MWRTRPTGGQRLAGEVITAISGPIALGDWPGYLVETSIGVVPFWAMPPRRAISCARRTSHSTEPRKRDAGSFVFFEAEMLTTVQKTRPGLRVPA